MAVPITQRHDKDDDDDDSNVNNDNEDDNNKRAIIRLTDQTCGFLRLISATYFHMHIFKISCPSVRLYSSLCSRKGLWMYLIAFYA